MELLLQAQGFCNAIKCFFAHLFYHQPAYHSTVQCAAVGWVWGGRGGGTTAPTGIGVIRCTCVGSWKCWKLIKYFGEWKVPMKEYQAPAHHSVY